MAEEALGAGAASIGAALVDDRQVTDLAAALTYYSIQAMVPAMIAGVSLLGLFGDGKETTNSVVTSIAAIAGMDESELGGIRNFIDGLQTSGGAGFAFFFGILLSLWSASGYVGAFARMQNRIYDVAEGRPVFKLRPWLYLVTIIQVIRARQAAESTLPRYSRPTPRMIRPTRMSSSGR